MPRAELGRVHNQKNFTGLVPLLIRWTPVTTAPGNISMTMRRADPTAICRQKLQEKGIGVVPTQARATAFQLRWDERLLMKVTSERIRNIIPAAIARLVIHVQTSSASFSTSSRSSGVMSTGLMFFSSSFGLTFFSLLGLLPVLSQNTPIQLSISNPRFRKRQTTLQFYDLNLQSAATPHTAADYP